MGRPKQLLDWGGQPLVRVVAEFALASQLDRVVVVVGAAEREVTGALAGLPLDLVHNPAYAEGLSTSLRAGIAALGPEVAAALVLLGDQPFVTPVIIDTILAAWHAGGGLIVVPTYGGQRGNPVLFDQGVFPDLLAVRGDQGARDVLAVHTADMLVVPFDDTRPLADIDTLDDYARLSTLY
jgi:molybdenum cofactor cytidylyltransferase